MQNVKAPVRHHTDCLMYCDYWLGRPTETDPATKCPSRVGPRSALTVSALTVLCASSDTYRARPAPKGGALVSGTCGKGAIGGVRFCTNGHVPAKILVLGACPADITSGNLEPPGGVRWELRLPSSTVTSVATGRVVVALSGRAPAALSVALWKLQESDKSPEEFTPISCRIRCICMGLPVRRASDGSPLHEARLAGHCASLALRPVPCPALLSLFRGPLPLVDLGPAGAPAPLARNARSLALSLPDGAR